MRRRKVSKLIVTWIAATGILIGLAAEASAAPETFDAASAQSLLPGGAALGSVTGVAGTTRSYDGTGPCTSGDDAQAAVFTATASQKSFLSIDVSDDLDGSASLCALALYGATSGSSLNPFDATQRDAHLVKETDGCADGSECSLESWLTAGRTYYVVFWSDPTEEAAFLFDASVEGASGVALAVAGHRIRNECTGYHEVITGRSFTVTSSGTSPSSGTIRFVLERRSGDTWSVQETIDRTLSGGTASLQLSAGPAGFWRVRAGWPAGDGIEEAIADAHIEYVQPNWARYPEGGVRLGVPWHRQQYRLTCEAAALRMAHNFHDPRSITGDLKALRTIGVDSRQKRGGRWGNPNRAFVGHYNGRMARTGYGVHYGPVARAATRYDPCRPSLGLSRYSWTELAGHLDDGFPVIVWGAHRGPSGTRRIAWRAWDGAWIRGWSVEHVWVVVGFRGTVARPTHFIVHDPSGGPKRTVTLSAFNGFTKYFRTAVVVRG